MKSLFIEARYRNPVFIGSNVLKLPEKIGLVTTVQFIEDLKNIKKEIEKKGKKIFTGRGRHTVYDGQVLGCDVNSAVSVCRNVDAFLYIGSGEFHPLAVALNTGKDVFTFNPMTKVFGKIDLKKTEKLNRKIKGSLVSFLSSKEIGVIVTTKPGQSRLNEALKLRKRFKEKNFYFILFDTIDFNQLENFNFVECFVNTACPRIAMEESLNLEKPIINIDSISK